MYIVKKRESKRIIKEKTKVWNDFPPKLDDFTESSKKTFYKMIKNKKQVPWKKGHEGKRSKRAVEKLTK